MKIEILMKSGHIYKPTDDFKDIKDVKLVIDTFKTDDGFIPFDYSMIKISEIAEIYPKGYHDYSIKLNVSGACNPDKLAEALKNTPIINCSTAEIAKQPTGEKIE